MKLRVLFFFFNLLFNMYSGVSDRPLFPKGGPPGRIKKEKNITGGGAGRTL